MQYSKKDDLVGTEYYEVGSEIEKFLGQWENTNPGTGQIKRINVSEEKGEYFLHAYGASDDGLIDLGKSKCALFSSRVDNSIIEGMTTKIELPFIHIDVAINLKYGVMVVQIYNTFLDGSKRSNYFGREFFHQRHDKN
ncbi:MAG: hypothetical protein AAFP19_19210 [Bacteroidota bacterium]